MTKEIQLTQGRVTLVDDEDYEQLNKHKWCAVHVADNHYYASRTEHLSDRKQTVYMHQAIMGMLSKGSGIHIDHINGDGLDNRRDNLRVCTHSQNLRNSGPRNPISGHKGVYPTGKSGKWKAAITENGKYQHLGVFLTLEAAARAYNKATLKYHSEFAYQNAIPAE